MRSLEERIPEINNSFIQDINFMLCDAEEMTISEHINVHWIFYDDINYAYRLIFMGFMK